MKSGKTTAAASFPKSLLLAFEKGYNAIGGIVAQDITKWADVKLVLRQLEKPEVRERFDTIIFDTASIAWDYVESFVCSQNGVTKISDIAWGAGYAQCKKEFESTLRKITLLGYGVVLLAHSVSRIENELMEVKLRLLVPTFLSARRRFVILLLTLLVISELSTLMERRNVGYTLVKLRLFSLAVDSSIWHQRFLSAMMS